MDGEAQDIRDASRQIAVVDDDEKAMSLSERDMEQLGLSTEEGRVGRVGGARERKRHVPKRRSVLYGTRKTNINTSRFK